MAQKVKTRANSRTDKKPEIINKYIGREGEERSGKKQRPDLGGS
jgi:hypothetical protein